MKKTIVPTLWVAAIMSFASLVQAQIPTTLGWYQIPNTQLSSQCPSFSQFPFLYGSCQNVIAAWSGGVADTKRNRLIVLGGGHGDYDGNEVYALDLNTLAMNRLNNPSSFNNACTDAQSDGSATSRHTYHGLAYAANADSMIVFSGSLANCGGFSVDIWSLGLPSLAWNHKIPNSPMYGGIPAADYDPNTGSVIFHDGAQLWSYNPVTNAFNPIAAFESGVGCSSGGCLPAGVVDPVHKLFFLIGDGQIFKYDMSGGAPPYIRQDISGAVSGCGAMVSGHGLGADWDSSQNKIVGWSGGNSVTILDPVSLTCTSSTFPNGPGAQQGNGTFGRFRYFPALNIFALVNDWQQNAYTLRLTNGTTPPPVITSAGSATGTAGSAFSYQITATNSPTSFNAAGLPAGLSVNTNTGLISGTPTAAATSSIALSATNSGGTGNVTLTLTINPAGPPQPPVITSAGSAAGTVGSVFNYQITATNSPTSFNATGLPAGLSVNTNTGLISGTPTAAATSSISLSATNAGGAGNATLTLTINALGGTTPDADFAARCTAPGVIACQGFDTAAAFAQATDPGSGFYYSASCPTLPATKCIIEDTDIFVSGGSSARWDIYGNTSDDAEGHYDQQFGNVAFNQNSTFYVQYAFRVDANWLMNWETVAQSSPKIANFYNSVGGSCAIEEIATNNAAGSGYPMMYGECGGTGFFTNPDGVTPNPQSKSGPEGYLIQQGFTDPAPTTGYNCANYVNSVPGPPYTGNCFRFQPNTWYTLYYKVHIGTWGQPNSSVEAYIAPYGQQLKKIINAVNWTLNQNGGGDAGFNRLMLTQFMTAKNPAAAHPTAHVWYDELIVSQQPIAQPGGSVPPTDTIPPTVSITSPVSGAMVSGTISVVGTAADNVAVASVQVAVDGGAFTNASGTTNWTFSLNTASLTNGAHTISAKAIDTSGNVSTVANISVTVSNSVPPPVITSAGSATGTMGSAFNYQITATNSPTSFNATGLPAGLSVNTSNGLISGIPSAAGTSNATISAANAGGTGSVTLVLTVNQPAPPSVSIVPLPTTTVSGTISLTATASGNAGIISVQFRLDGTNLGSPLTAAPYTLSWNSAQASVGTHILTAVASDAAGNRTASAPVTVSVVRGADATPGLRSTSVFPNPAVKQDPTIRAFLGQVNSMEITIFDGSGQVVHNANLGGAPTGIINGQYYYDYKWTGSKASGVYFAVIHGKAADGAIIRARTKFAVMM